MLLFTRLLLAIAVLGLVLTTSDAKPVLNVLNIGHDTDEIDWMGRYCRELFQTDDLPFNLYLSDATVQESTTGKVLKMFIENMMRGTSQNILIGPSRKGVSQIVAEVTSFYNLVQVIYNATTSALSNKKTYRNTIRMRPTHDDQRNAIGELFSKFNWTKTHILYQGDADPDVKEQYIRLRAQLRKYNIMEIESLSFNNDAYDQLKTFRGGNMRLGIALWTGHTKDFKGNENIQSIGNLPEEEQRAYWSLECQIFKTGMYTSNKARYQWVFVQPDYQKFVRNQAVGCTEEEADAVLNGAIIVKTSISDYEDLPTTIRNSRNVSTPNEINADYKKWLSEQDTSKASRKPIGVNIDPFFVDGFYTAIELFRQAYEKASQNWYPNGARNRDDVKAMTEVAYPNMRKINFNGMSGPVEFIVGKDHITRAITLSYYQIRALDYKFKSIGMYRALTKNNLTTDTVEIQDEKIHWVGKEPPPTFIFTTDKFLSMDEEDKLPIRLAAAAAMLVALGGVALIASNGQRSIMQNSCHKLDMAMGLGSVFLIASVYFYQEEQAIRNIAICFLRPLFLAVGFSSTFGVMFLKLWKAHALFTAKNEEEITNVNMHIGLIYVLMIAIDFGIIIVFGILDGGWVVKDDVIQVALNVDNPFDAHYVRSMLTICWSKKVGMFESVFFGYKGLILVFGLFYAYDIREVFIEQVYDTRRIGMACGNYVAGVLVIIALYKALPSLSFGVLYIIYAALTITCVILTLTLIYMPKLIYIWKEGDEADSKFDAWSKDMVERQKELMNATTNQTSNKTHQQGGGTVSTTKGGKTNYGLDDDDETAMPEKV